MIINKAWQSSKHPRNAKGQFSKKTSVSVTSAIQQKRIQLANKSPLLKNIPLLQFNRKNWKSVITNEMNKLEYTLKNQKIVCNSLNKQVTDCNKTHVYIKNGKIRPMIDIINHASYIPFIIPVLQNGIVDYSQNRIMKNGKTSSEVVCRADIKTSNGIQRIGVSVIVVHNNDKLTLEAISVFKIKDNKKLIKSCPPQAQRGLSDFHGILLQDSINKCAFNNFSITDLTKMSMNGDRIMKSNLENIHIHLVNVNELNVESKFRKFESLMNGILKTKDLKKANTYIGKELTQKEFCDMQSTMNKSITKNIKKYKDTNIHFLNLDLSDKDRIEKALRTMSFALNVFQKASNGEIFFYKAQEELTEKWCKFFANFVHNTYDFVTDYFELPKKTVMLKASLTHKGKVLYYPESGKPIDLKDWNNFVKNLEKFLNRNITDTEKKIVLQSNNLGRILNKMLKYNTLEAVKSAKLSSITYHGKSFDWISESTKNMKNVFGEDLQRYEMARIETMIQSASIKVTNVTDKMRGDIKQILIDGIKSKHSKSQVSQALFDKMVGNNRDFQRVADTEIQNAFNNAFVREEVQNAESGEKVYFQRIEIIDGNTCKFCKQMNGKIALWSDKPLRNEKSKDPIADFTIWEGKEWNGKEHCFSIGVFHPYCRGSWVRYYKDIDNKRIDALIAERNKESEKWNNALSIAKKEFKEKGIKNPDDFTKGFTERINELMNNK